MRSGWNLNGIVGRVAIVDVARIFTIICLLVDAFDVMHIRVKYNTLRFGNFSGHGLILYTNLIQHSYNFSPQYTLGEFEMLSREL
jgi:hypothetical protein